jgi:hypothetical protein
VFTIRKRRHTHVIERQKDDDNDWESLCIIEDSPPSGGLLT